jgi:hypothetical protein
VRVVAQLDHYFNYGFERGQYVSVKLAHIGGESINGYFPRGHPDFKALLDHLYDGKPHRIVLEVHPSRETSVAALLEFVADSWVMPDPKEGAAGGQNEA